MPSLSSDNWKTENSPYINRFLQPDTIIPDLSNPQSWNRYSYVRNNPVNLNDPTGHKDSCGDNGSGCSSNYTPPPDPVNDDVQCQNDPDCELNGNHDEGGNGLGYEPNQDDEFFDWDRSRGCYDLNGNRHGCAGYYSIAIGLDVPTVMMLLGLGISLFAPEIGAPLALTGLLLETCAYAGVPGCIAVKTISLNLSITVDSYGNLYAGPQISIGKSLLPLISFSNNMGAIYSHDQQPPTEAQVRDHLTGFSLSAGTLATGGINYSPLASDIKTSFYTVGLPELASANINLYNFRLFDFIQ